MPGGNLDRGCVGDRISGAVDVGNRLDRDFPEYHVQLLIGGVVAASVDETWVNPEPGTFATAAASYTTTADAGKPLGIRLWSSGEQPNFDNVRLTRSMCGSPPVVMITSPAGGSSFSECDTIDLAGTAGDTRASGARRLACAPLARRRAARLCGFPGLG